MNTVRYGIVGIGKQGSIYASFLRDKKVDGAQLTAVCDIDEKRIDWAKENLKDVKIFKDYKEMFNSGLVDAIVVNTPHYIHPEIVEEALKAGLNVLTDKPIGVYTKRVNEMLKVKDQHPNQTFGIIWNQRTNPLYRRAKEIIESGEAGEITRVNWIITNWYRTTAYYSQAGWRGSWNGEGGGVLLNQAPHQLDLITWLCGLPKSVFALCKTVGRNISVENDVTALLEFENGSTGVFVTTTHDAPGTNRLEITLEGGKIVIEAGVLTYTKNEMLEPLFNKTNTEFWGFPKNEVITYSEKLEPIDGYNGNLEHINIFRNYTDYLLGKTNKLIANGAEGIKSLYLSNAIYLSSYLNKRIDIPFDEDLFIEFLDLKRENELKNK